MSPTALVGFRIREPWTRPDPALLAGFLEASSAQVADAMHRFGAMDSGIRPVWASPPVTGSALTVWARSADNLMMHHALALAQPGDVLVVNTQGNLTNAGFGELMATTAARVGIAAVIVDGVVRDAQALERLALPVFARGLNPNGCDKVGPGEIGSTIACGGVAVRSGDIIVADADGVTIVPLDDAQQVLASARAAVAREADRLAAIARGELFNPSIEPALRAAKVIE